MENIYVFLNMYRMIKLKRLLYEMLPYYQSMQKSNIQIQRKTTGSCIEESPGVREYVCIFIVRNYESKKLYPQIQFHQIKKCKNK